VDGDQRSDGRFLEASASLQAERALLCKRAQGALGFFCPLGISNALCPYARALSAPARIAAASTWRSAGSGSLSREDHQRERARGRRHRCPTWGACPSAGHAQFLGDACDQAAQGFLSDGGNYRSRVGERIDESRRLDGVRLVLAQEIVNAQSREIVQFSNRDLPIMVRVGSA
jgi:hypothetical protein